MATHRKHIEKGAFYFVTFTCYQWLPLIDATKLYDYLPTWMKHLKNKGMLLCGYVAMPNHLHFLFFVEDSCSSLNKAIGEGKRFMAYEIVKRLQKMDDTELLETLKKGVQPEERKKGKKHQVFRLSFDAKFLKGEKEVIAVLDYIHKNPVKGKWSLVSDYTDYLYSSASFYELGLQRNVEVLDYRYCVSESSTE